ncbi:uncharacterized protein IAS62_005960 [Cryptococcus decagattii]|uniref:Uncharacterized protein n=1 Tax=Cryptococcus decagattii TaxID=1859122 RepID=A0ABZ2B1C2_9TREE
MTQSQNSFKQALLVHYVMVLEPLGSLTTAEVIGDLVREDQIPAAGLRMGTKILATQRTSSETSRSVLKSEEVDGSLRHCRRTGGDSDGYSSAPSTLPSPAVPTFIRPSPQHHVTTLCKNYTSLAA